MTHDIVKDARRLIPWLAAYAVSVVGTIGVYGYAIGHPEVLLVPDLQFGLVDSAEILSFLIFLPAAFLTLRWVYRANANAQTLAGGLGVSPAWNVGWFFVPIAHLWKPFAALLEVSAAGIDPDDRTDRRNLPVLWAWWAFWIASDVVGWLSLWLTWDLYGVDAAPYLPLAMAASASGLVATLLLMRVVLAMSRAQANALMRQAFA